MEDQDHNIQYQSLCTF